MRSYRVLGAQLRPYLQQSLTFTIYMTCIAPLIDSIAVGEKTFQFMVLTIVLLGAAAYAFHHEI